MRVEYSNAIWLNANALMEDEEKSARKVLLVRG
jgi:hypothetical protein